MAHTEQIFRNLLTNIAAEQHFADREPQVAPMSTDGANYTSNLYLATLSDGDRELKLFAKVAAIGEKMRSQFPVKLYDIERLFYTKLAKVFSELEEEAGVPERDRFRIPKLYGYNGNLYEETIVLEDLSSRGFMSFNRFTTVSWQYASSAITELAKFHALSVAYEAKDPDGFAKELDELKFNANEDSQIMSVWDKIVQKAVDATKEENKEGMKKFFEKHFKAATDSFIKLLSPGKMRVIGHGDYRPSNLMHRDLEDGTVEVIPVDYQTLRGGGPVVDLYYFIFTGTDKKFRANYYESLLEHYYTELCAALTRLGLDPNEKYSREDYDAELKEKLPFGLGVAVFTLPIVTVEAENAPVVDEHMDISSFSIQKTSSLFEERLNGVVDDFVRWGVL